MGKAKVKEEETKELVETEKNKGADVIPFGDGIEMTGYEDIDQSMFVIPRMKIVQPNTQDPDAVAGTFMSNLTGEQFDTLPIVAVKITRGRVMWSKNEFDKPPLCRSFDGMEPDLTLFEREETEAEGPPSPVCAERTQKGKISILTTVCPKAKWGPNKQRPDCDETFNILAIMTTDFTPFWISFSGMSVAPVKRFVTAIAMRNKKLWTFQTEFSAKQVTNKKGKFYILDFTPPKPINEEIRDDITEMVERLQHESMKRAIDAEETVDEDASASGGSGDMPDWMREEESK